MDILIQKFGGTSVATQEGRDLVLKKIQGAHKEGYNLVIVVSAMGRKGDPYATDTLLSLARETSSSVATRELDLVMCCGEIISAVVMTAAMQEVGLSAVMLTGGQAGIITDNNFNNARAIKCDDSRLIKLLDEGKIPVVCGFQGITEDGEFTTLGRGGSDTTAAILGTALNAKQIDIYTDVEGIMTADPKIVNDAKKLNFISYAEVCQLAHQGAKVIHPRAVEIVMQKNIPIAIKSTFSDAPGTIITNINKESATPSDQTIADRVATSVTYLPDVVQFKINFGDNMPNDATYKVFKIMADNGISVDLINIYPGQIMFTVSSDNSRQAALKLGEAGYNLEIVQDCAKVSVVGGGMREAPGVMANFVEALSRKDIPILQTVDSHTSISVLVQKNNVRDAVKALHENFGLAN